MKKKLIFIVALFVSIGAKSQSLVALSHNSVSTFHSGINGLVSAYNNAVNGDTIYLPGGFLTPVNLIDKQIVIYGAGHYPDSTVATEKTILTGGFSVSENADNFRIEGVQINGDITFNTNEAASNVIVKRCRFNTLNYPGNLTNPCQNNLIIQNVIDGWIYGSNAQSLLLTNNIISGKIQDMNTNVLQNNILLADFYTGYPYYSTTVMMNMNNSTIKNNIIFNTDVNLISGTGNIVKNNIFQINWNVGPNISTANYFSVNFATLFINQSGNGFSYAHDYHLQSPASFVGEDATQVGLYGGSWPYKEGSVPGNPHIISKSISPQTNTSGDININIKVAAQND